MPESAADQSLRSARELENFRACGDARGPQWLLLHPEARAKAAEMLAALSASLAGATRTAVRGS